MNEMRQLIGKRLESDGTPRTRAGTLPSSPALRLARAFSPDDTAGTLQEIVSEADHNISRAASNYDTMQQDIQLLADDFKEVSGESVK